MNAMEEMAARENKAVFESWGGGEIAQYRSKPSGARVPLWLRQIRRIIADTAEAYGVTEADILGPSRKEWLVDARTEIVREARDNGISLNKIAFAMNRHWTSIRNLAKREVK